MTNDERRPDERRPGEESAVTYYASSDETLSEAVVNAVAVVSGTPPVPKSSDRATPERTMEPLYSVVDTDALDSVFRKTTPEGAAVRGRITFSYHGHEVTVRSEGRISVE